MYAQPLPTDNDLLADYLAGNEQSFNTLLKRHKNKLFHYILKRVKQREDAKDVFSQTRCEALNSLHQNKSRPHKSFENWLYGIALHCIGLHFREKGKIMEVHDDEADIELNYALDSSHNCEERYIYNDSSKELRSHLKSLPRDQRELLLLHFYFGKQAKELSVQMHIPANHVSHRLCYAVKHLKKVVG